MRHRSTSFRILQSCLIGSTTLFFSIGSLWGVVSPLSVHGSLSSSPMAVHSAPSATEILESAVDLRRAFQSAAEKNICFTVSNYGENDVKVRLLRKDNLAGEFTVHPYHTSAICSSVTTIELGCHVQPCQTRWRVSETP